MVDADGFGGHPEFLGVGLRMGVDLRGSMTATSASKRVLDARAGARRSASGSPCERPAASEFFDEAAARLKRAVPFDGACWHTLDPGSDLITQHRLQDLPDRFPVLANNEYAVDDVNKFAQLASRRAQGRDAEQARPPATLSAARAFAICSATPGSARSCAARSSPTARPGER